jgi:hypothetical protein
MENCGPQCAISETESGPECIQMGLSGDVSKGLVVFCDEDHFGIVQSSTFVLARASFPATSRSTRPRANRLPAPFVACGR